MAEAEGDVNSDVYVGPCMITYPGWPMWLLDHSVSSVHLDTVQSRTHVNASTGVTFIVKMFST